MNRRSLLIGAGGTLLLAGAGTAAWTLAVGSMTAYGAYAGRMRARLTAAPDIRDLVRYAALAANSHNTQPWRFTAGDGVIDILPDGSRRTPVVDPDGHHLFVSLGSAAENLSIAAAATGRPGEMELSQDGVRYVFSSGPESAGPLLAAIEKRQSTRAGYDGRSVPAADLSRLELAAARPKIRLILITDRARVGRMRDLVIAGNSMQMADPAFMRELKQWVRFNPRSAMASGDGLFSAASGNPILPTMLGDLAFDQFFRAGAENDRYARHIASSPGVAVFLAEREDKAHWIEVGRACQRFALAATSLGLKCAFINQPVEVASLRSELAALVGESGLRPDIVMSSATGQSCRSRRAVQSKRC
ncbi:Acg family FMN-binding oxidoreductase [Mesorhizobium sp. ES1-4]|uniref:Acg family FMN-binding oxidoreductase n=1 Tax=Mesorhizobium sp. ES1-4 TaxID=2876627 RepID=UPI002961FD26|nr:nitroreductase family protein [Mesorhizobium sp. ES1-4]